MAAPYQPPAESPNDENPCWLCSGRVFEHWHSGSMTRRIKQLYQTVSEAYVELNRADADELGIADGEAVKLVSRQGEQRLKANFAKAERLYRGALPDSTLGFMREDCSSCHAVPAARAEIRCSHPQRTNCRQCHVPGADTVAPPDLATAAL